MYFKDVLIGFAVACIIVLIALVFRPRVTSPGTQKYFLPALLIKLVSSVLLGMLYYFYYGGGDTATYFSHGAIHIYHAFWDSPSKGLHLIFGATDYGHGVYTYASKIWMYHDPSSYLVVRIAGFISLFVGGSYIGTGFIFATLSFTGIWAMYYAFVKIFPGKEFVLALAILFIPSSVFWGSGILKDTITFGFLGWSIAAFIHLFYGFGSKVKWALVLLVSFYLIYLIKLYILMSLLPSLALWSYFLNINRVKNKMLKLLVAPVVIALTLIIAVFGVYWVGKNNRKYAIENLAKTVQITAYDVGRYTGKNAGSRYDLGDLDGSFGSILVKAPAAINVSLFRPYLWEVNNPLMLLAGLEGSVFFLLTCVVLIKSRTHIINSLSNPAILFSLVFALSFAFAVGIVSYNFGTLFRYKVPLMPFYGIFLAIAWSKAKEINPNVFEELPQNSNLITY